MPSAPSCPVGFCKELQTASAQVARHQKQFDSVRSLDNTFCNWHCAALRAIFARYSHMKQTITLTHCISDTLHFCSLKENISLSSPIMVRLALPLRLVLDGRRF